MANPIEDMLKERAKQGKFLKISNGETVRMLIKDYEKATGFQGRDTIAFQVDVYYSDGLKEKVFQCTNAYFLEAVINLPKQGKGQEVEVKRIGERTDTVYEVKPAKQEEEPPEPDEEL